MVKVKLFRVYYEDGNQRLFEAPSRKDIREYCLEHVERDGAVRKIKEVVKDEAKRV